MSDNTSGHKLVVSYWWQPPTSPMLGGTELEPELAFQAEHARLPRVGQVITWLLPSPRTVGQTPPPVIAKGEVTAVKEVEETPIPSYVVMLERCEAGLSYDELCACIHTQVVGFHPEFGPVEGQLIGLLPRNELAGVADPFGHLFIDSDEGDEDEPVIWVDWSTIWTFEGLEQYAAAS